MTSSQTTLITGASSGIGHAFAKEFAKHGYNLLLTARNKDDLSKTAEEMRSTYHVNVEVLSLDLNKPKSCQDLFDWATSQERPVTCLVNNAGMGNYGKYEEIPWKKEEELLRVNIMVVSELCHLFIPYFLKNKQGKILNIASMASFQPGPLFTTYYASKAYVLNFTEALALENKHTPLTISAVCPGPSPTNFFTKANFPASSLLMRTSMLPPEKVAKAGYSGLMRKKTVIIPSVKYALIPVGSRVFPRKTVTRISKKFIDIAAKG